MAGVFPITSSGQLVTFTFAIDLARAEIKMMTRDVDFPTLSAAEIELLVRKAKRQDVNRNLADSYERWLPATVYNVGDIVTPDPRNGVYFTATVGGTSGTTQPTWLSNTALVGQTVADNGITWSLTGAAPWTPTWNLAYGISQGWKMKMGKAVGAYDIQVGGQLMKRSQLLKNMKEVWRLWARRASAWDQVAMQGSLRDRRLFQNITNQNDELFIDGQIAWGVLDEFYTSRGFTGLSAGGQFIDP